jgi:lysosomal acid lipase/cholesteryl ester hydrolase
LNFVGHFPGTAALNDVIHFSQMYKSGKFQKFDYGRIKNFELYGQDEPPQYDLGQIKVPTYLLYGKNDVFTSKKVMYRSYFESSGTVIIAAGRSETF